MISTNNKKIYEFCKRYINHGSILKVKKNSNKFVYNKDYFGTNLRITEIQSIAGLEQLKYLKKIQRIRDKMAKDYFDLISKYQKYFYSYYPSRKIKSAWYRFYFFLKINNNDNQKARYKIIKNLKKNNLRCFTGSCPEIYLEKSFRKLKGFRQKRLKNCKILGKTSIALDLNHTMKNFQHKKNLLKFNNVLEKFSKTSK